MIEQISKFVREREQEMFALLERLVRVNSYTTDKKSVDAVADIIQEFMKDSGFLVRRQGQAELGDNLVAENRLRNKGGGVLLCGHMDTVFPRDMGFDCFDRRDDGTLNGPGVVDMKGGLVVGIYALKALEAAGLLKDMPVAFVFNSDEEIGSPQSCDLIIEESEKSDVAFVFECANPGGEVATARKGKQSFDITVHGQSGHSGNFKGDEKPSAILELARLTIGLEELNNAETGVTVNVGLINGGVGPNTVAPKATAYVECRYPTEEYGQAVRDAVHEMAENPKTPGTTVEVKDVPGRPAMAKSDGIAALYDLVAEAAEELDIPILENARGGVSDANFIAMTGTPVIDGMGPIGGRDHSPDEYMEIDSLVERTILSAVSMRRAWEQFKK